MFNFLYPNWFKKANWFFKRIWLKTSQQVTSHEGKQWHIDDSHNRKWGMWRLRWTHLTSQPNFVKKRLNISNSSQSLWYSGLEWIEKPACLREWIGGFDSHSLPPFSLKSLLWKGLAWFYKVWFLIVSILVTVEVTFDHVTYLSSLSSNR